MTNWGLAGTDKASQYNCDLVADSVIVDILSEEGLGILSEESGLHFPDRQIIVVVDPVDGSTNASRGIPWYASSLCAVDDQGMVASVVLNLASGDRFEALRSKGATRNGEKISPSGSKSMASSIVATSGYPPKHLGWQQYRSLGAAALDICAVAQGCVDAYFDAKDDAIHPWDYMGALLVCQEAGGVFCDAQDRELVITSFEQSRSLIVASTPQLLEELKSLRADAIASSK